jgi:hypothetical protein
VLILAKRATEMNDMVSIDQERENAALKARISTLEAQVAALLPKPAPKPVIEEGARVIQPIPTSSFVMPTGDELEQLLELVFANFPQWRPKDWDDDFERSKYVRGFGRAMCWINSVARLPAPNTKRYFSYWTEKAEDWLYARGAPRDVWGLMAAAIVSGVPYVLPDQAAGIVAALGLGEYGEARPDEATWRHTLKSGILPKPVIPQTLQSRSYPIPDVQIRTQQLNVVQGARIQGPSY